MRAGALAVLWAPVAALIPAALEPGAAVEYAIIALLCLALGALTDALVPWPRAPLAPALVAIVALSVDALAGTQLLMRSLLGPDPILGARFYGIGNELKSGLAVLVLAAVAAALYPRARGRGAALAMAGAGVVLAVVEGSARIGAGVGGVILVSVRLRGRHRHARSRRAHPQARADRADQPGRRPGGARRDRPRHRARERALHRQRPARPLGGRRARHHRPPLQRRVGRAAQPRDARGHGRRARPAPRSAARARAPAGACARRTPYGWRRFAGGLAAGVVGALVEDSGPVLLVVAVFALGCVATYLWGRPVGSAPQVMVPAHRSESRPRHPHGGIRTPSQR